MKQTNRLCEYVIPNGAQRSEDSLAFCKSKALEIPRFARNDKTNPFCATWKCSKLESWINKLFANPLRLCVFACGFFLIGSRAIGLSNSTETSEGPRLQILENTSRRLRFQIQFLAPYFSQEKINGIEYDVPRLPGFDLVHNDGQPALPMTSCLIILPPDGMPVITVEKTAGENFGAKNLLPALVPNLFSGTDSLFYSLSNLSSQKVLAVEPARIVEAGWWRGYRLGRLSIVPMQIPADGSVQFYSSFTVSVEFQESPDSRFSPPTLEEKQVLKTALNFPNGARWRRDDLPQRTRGAIAQADEAWKIPEDSDAFKIAVNEDGLYSLSYEYLDSAGVPIDQWQPSFIHLWHRGEEAPLYFVGDSDSLFEAGERFVFWGARRRGEKSYYNDCSDENIFWLTGDATHGLRMAERRVTDDPTKLPNTYFFEKKHFEEDELYYHGDNSAELFNTLQLPGEGWIWRRLLAGEQFQTSLLLQNTVTEAPLCSLTVHLRGITFDPVKPNHRIQFLLNGNSIGETFFSDNQNIIFRAEFPSSFARVGNNNFVVKSVGGTGAAIDQIYFDWVEIGYWRSYVASDNFVPFRAGVSAISEKPEDRFVLFNLHSANIEIYDRTRQQVLSGFAVNQYNSTQWQASFIDSAANDFKSDYLALTPEALKTPAGISRNSPSSLWMPTNAADYIILTHRDFRNAAERLANHRRSTGENFGVAVADVEDVYDEFNFGMPDPEAIRNFFRHAYENWPSPAPRYALLIGDASWDPKLNNPTSHEQNFILPFGNPVSDNRFVCFDGENDFIPEMFIGRLPVETAEQAEVIVDKIIAYENGLPQSWHKNFTFLNGGIDSFEQQLFLNQTEGLINRYILPAPVGGKPARLYKNTPGRFIGELREEILSSIDNGTVILNFLGHAGSQTWELMLINNDVFDLQNHERLPFITSMSCHTARYANPDQDSFGETFVRLPERGAVAFWGTSGWGFVFQDGVLLDKMFEALVQDSVRTLGMLTTLAKIGLLEQWGTGITNVSTIDHYSLLGDPALMLALPRQPELVMQPAQISFSPPAPTDQTVQVNVKVVVRNFGLATTDSVGLAIDAVAPNNLKEKLFAGSLRPIGFSDSVQVSWQTLDNRGEYRIRAGVDRQGLITELDESNNDAENSIYFFTNSITPASPARYAKLSEPRPNLTVHNPASANQQGLARSYFFEVDTSADFSSGFHLASPAIPEGILQTSWQMPQSLQNGLYFWRSRVSESEVESPWQTSSFRISSNEENGFAQSGVTQLSEAIFSQTKIDSSIAAISLAPDPSRALPLEVQSAGYEDATRCYLIVDFQLTNAAVQSRGHQILALDPVTHEIIAGPRYFDTAASTEQADSLAMFIEALPARTLVLTGIRDDGSQRMTERAYQALESLGSAMTRQVGFRDGWAMIGQKGWSVGQAVEAVGRRGEGTAAARFTHQPFYKSGEVHSLIIGPASVWKILRWRGNTGVNATILAIDVLGRNQNESSWSLVRSNVGNEQPLNDVDAQRYPFLQLVARLADDDGLDTPHLMSWEIDYDGGVDLAVGISTIEISPDTVFAGEEVTVRAEVYNFGENEISAPVKFSFNHPDSGRKVFATNILSIPAAGSSVMNAIWYSIDARGRVDLFVEVDPENQIAESYELNNLATAPAHIIADSSSPELRVTIDGKNVMPGDFVSAEPLITCEVFDDGVLTIDDTSRLNILLDGVRVSHRAAGQALSIEELSVSRLKARIQYRPNLDDGNHLIEFFVRDASRNTGYVRAEVLVKTDFQLSNVMNYPNPFARETEFTYYLTQPAERIGIKIFTLSGKLIRSFDDAPLAAGFNRLLWDGRDADGDELANGVYLYKISARREGRVDEEIQKCVVMR